MPAQYAVLTSLSLSKLCACLYFWLFSVSHSVSFGFHIDGDSTFVMSRR